MTDEIPEWERALLDQQADAMIREETCDYPGCDQRAVALLANDAPVTSSEYAERVVCRWHRRNAFGGGQ